MVGGLRTSRTIDTAGHPSDSIWLCCGNNSFLVHISDGPSFGNAELHWEILSFEIRPAERGVILSPQVIQVIIEAGVICLKGVAPCSHALGGFNPIASEVVNIPRLESFRLNGQVGSENP